MTGPLDGIKVLDLTRLLPGPYCTLLLADMGAEVLKIESKGRGDMIRYKPPLIGELGASFIALNRGKKSVAVDLGKPAGREAVRRLARQVDVLVEGFRPGVMEQLDLEYPSLDAQHPGLIYCSISGYGQIGPYRDRAGHDLNYQALAGILGSTGPKGGPPELPAVQVADLAGGAFNAALSIVAALFQRERTGRGQHLDISMTDGALALMTMPLAEHLVNGGGAAPGTLMLNGGLVNYRTYRTRDGRSIALGALEAKFWTRFLERVGRPEFAERLQQDDPGEREAVREDLAALIRTRDRDEWIAMLAEDDVCCEPVLDADEVVHHPLHLARGMIREVEVRNSAPVRTISTPLPFRETFSSSDDPERLPAAPLLGEHTRTVLAEYGFSAREIDSLQAQGGI